MPTRAGLVAAVFVAGVALVLITLSLRTSDDTESFQYWIYPNSSPFAAVTNSEIRAAVFTTRDNFTNVADWYSERTRIRGTGNPMFTGRGGGLFSHRMVEQAGRLGTRMSSVAATESFFILRHTRGWIVHVSWNSADNYTTISVVLRESLPSATNAIYAMGLVNALAPTSSIRGSGGSMINIATHAFTDTNSPAKLQTYWDAPTNFTTNSAKTGSPWFVPGSEFTRAQLIRLPVGASARTNEADFIFLTPLGMSLLHLAGTSNNTTELVIGSVSR